MVLLMGFGVLCRQNQVTGAWYQTTDMIAIGIITRIYLLPSVRSEEKENFSRGYINFKTCHCKIKEEMKRIARYSSDEIPAWQVKIAICNWYNVNICCEVFFFLQPPRPLQLAKSRILWQKSGLLEITRYPAGFCPAPTLAELQNKLEKYMLL